MPVEKAKRHEAMNPCDNTQRVKRRRTNQALSGVWDSTLCPRVGLQAALPISG